MRRRRRLGTVLAVLGVGLVAYAAAVLFWRDPVTDVYARWQQHRLESALEAAFAGYAEAAPLPAASRDGERKALADAARGLRRDLRLGAPLGRIVIPKIDLEAVVVHGTRWGPDLSKGPGHYQQTSLPGLGKTTAIAGHRTTFGAPFRHIDELERGDVIVLDLPYGTFRYRVFAHEIVKSDDWSIIRERGFDTLVLSACHPLYSASQRWVVFARLAGYESARNRTSSRA